MTPQPQERKRRVLWTGYVVGAALTVLLGKLLLLPPESPDHSEVRLEFKALTPGWLLFPVRQGLAGLSFDLPFLVSRSEVPANLVLVLLDSKVKLNLGQPTDQPLDRRFYTQLLERLTQDGAKLVLCDILFDQAHADAAVDAQFAEAMRKHGRVVLVGDYVRQFQGNIATYGPIPPIPVLADAAAGWGLARISPDPDFAIRKLDAGVEDHPSAGWVAASALNSTTTQMHQERRAPRWLNYYCAPDRLTAVNFDHALQPDGLPKGFFRDKIVIFGSRPSVGISGAEREEFPSPYSRFGGLFSSGPAIHAFTLLNLHRGDWMTRLSARGETVAVVLWGLFISVCLMRLRPWLAACVAVMGAGLFAAGSMYVQIRQHVWFPWLVPAAVQTGVALAWSVGFQYVVEYRRQHRLRRAFSAYLSPYMADRIANSDFDLSLGGQEVEATVMFADLEGFTKMSETLTPSEVSKVLTAYFNQTTRFILEENAIIIKFIGDAVLAAWGVPLPEPKHAERAVRAAWAMHQASQREVEGRLLRTRIGISTGLVLAGNLGSELRFDYTVIGDTTNLASRLESLNKSLGTDILISDSTRHQIGDNLRLRDLGRFIVAGKTQSIGVFEVLGPAENFSPEPAWLNSFAKGLEHFVRRELDESEQLFRRAVEERRGDRASEFYLGQIQKARAQTRAGEPWDGAIRLESK